MNLTINNAISTETSKFDTRTDAKVIVEKIRPKNEDELVKISLKAYNAINASEKIDNLLKIENPKKTDMRFDLVDGQTVVKFFDKETNEELESIPTKSHLKNSSRLNDFLDRLVKDLT